jgi:hypothetical protein
VNLRKSLHGITFERFRTQRCSGGEHGIELWKGKHPQSSHPLLSPRLVAESWRKEHELTRGTCGGVGFRSKLAGTVLRSSRNYVNCKAGGENRKSPTGLFDLEGATDYRTQIAFLLGT